MTNHHYDPDRHHRRSIRLSGWDYRTHAFYFVTLCTHDWENLFEAEPFRDIAAIMWSLIPGRHHASGVTLDEWVVMPNHLHGLLLLPGPAGDDPGDMAREAIAPGLPFDLRYAAHPPSEAVRGERPKTLPGSLGAIIGNYKSGVSRRINALRRTPGRRVWHRGYYERIVRNHHELARIQTYILENPARWAEDNDNLDALLERMIYRGDES